jgi:hypothetical protein
MLLNSIFQDFKAFETDVLSVFFFRFIIFIDQIII